MQIDEQFSNALVPIREAREPDSKFTLETVLQPEKQVASNHSIFFAIVTSDTFPRYRLIVTPSKSTRKAPHIPKCKLPSPTNISPTFVPNSAEPLNSSRLAGMKNVDNLEQSEKAQPLIYESREGDSKVTAERDRHRAKQF
jgi:hypothetical protein